MKNNTTHENLIKCIYNECSEYEENEIELLKLLDSELYTDFINFKFIQSSIDSLKLNPSIRVQKNILAYAQI